MLRALVVEHPEARTWDERLALALLNGASVDLKLGRLPQARAQIEESVKRLRSEEHTSELQSLMRISYAVFCLKKKKNTRCTQQDQRKQRQYIEDKNGRKGMKRMTQHQEQ